MTLEFKWPKRNSNISTAIFEVYSIFSWKKINYPILNHKIHLTGKVLCDAYVVIYSFRSAVFYVRRNLMMYIENKKALK